MTYKAVGIDPGLAQTSIVLLSENNNNCVSKIIKTNPKDSKIERLFQIEKGLNEFFSKHNPDLIILENYAFGVGRSDNKQKRKASMAFDMGEVGWCIRRQLALNCCKFYVISNTTIKKFACHGRAQKDEMLLYVYKNWGITFKDHNLADAYAMAKLGMAILGKEPELTKVQESVVRDISKKKETDDISYYSYKLPEVKI